MKNTNWREIVEIVGIVSIVASLLLLANEVRHSNRIANAEISLQLTETANVMLLARATDPEVAKLFAKLRDPSSHLITATEKEQISAIARRYMNVTYSMQVSADQGFLSESEFAGSIEAFRLLLSDFPGLRPDVIDLYEQTESLHGLRMFEPLRELIAAEEAARRPEVQ